MEFLKDTVLKSPSIETIRRFESNYRIKFPSIYLHYLTIGNGGVPTKRRFYQGKKERLIERMLCLLDNPTSDNENGWYDISVVITQIEERLVNDPDIIGVNVVPFAALFAGDFLCLDYRENRDSPSVSVWEHENSDVFKPHLENIANSIEDFRTF